MNEFIDLANKNFAKAQAEKVEEISQTEVEKQQAFNLGMKYGMYSGALIVFGFVLLLAVIGVLGG